MFVDIEAIFFDLDNTLIDRDAAFLMAIKEILKTNNQEILTKVANKDNYGFTSRKEFCDWFIEEFNIRDYSSDDFFQVLARKIVQNTERASDELLMLLKSLAKKYRLGILTNGSKKNQMGKIDMSQLSKIFSENQIFISGNYKISKPNPDIFKIVLNHLKIEPENLLYVGDNPINDIFGAQQLNIKTLWVSHQRDWNENFKYDFMIDDILELRNTPFGIKL